MSTKSYLSHSAAVILHALDSGYKYGFDIMDITGLPSGTVYPALRRLEDLALVDSKWEKEGIAQRDGRPARVGRAETAIHGRVRAYANKTSAPAASRDVSVFT